MPSTLLSTIWNLDSGAYEILVNISEQTVNSPNQLSNIQRLAISERSRLDIPADNFYIANIKVSRNGRELSAEEEKNFWQYLNQYSRSTESIAYHYDYSLPHNLSAQDLLIREIFQVNGIIEANKYREELLQPKLVASLQSHSTNKKDESKIIKTVFDNTLIALRGNYEYEKAIAREGLRGFIPEIKEVIGAKKVEFRFAQNEYLQRLAEFKYLESIGKKLSWVSRIAGGLDSYKYYSSKRDERNLATHMTDMSYAISDTTAKYYFTQNIVKPVARQVILHGIASLTGVEIPYVLGEVIVFGSSIIVPKLGWKIIRSQTLDYAFDSFDSNIITPVIKCFYPYYQEDRIEQIFGKNQPGREINFNLHFQRIQPQDNLTVPQDSKVENTSNQTNTPAIVKSCFLETHPGSITLFKNGSNSLGFFNWDSADKEESFSRNSLILTYDDYLKQRRPSLFTGRNTQSSFSTQVAPFNFFEPVKIYDVKRNKNSENIYNGIMNDSSNITGSSYNNGNSVFEMGHFFAYQTVKTLKDLNLFTSNSNFSTQNIFINATLHPYPNYSDDSPNYNILLAYSGANLSLNYNTNAGLAFGHKIDPNKTNYQFTFGIDPKKGILVAAGATIPLEINPVIFIGGAAVVLGGYGIYKLVEYINTPDISPAEKAQNKLTSALNDFKDVKSRNGYWYRFTTSWSELETEKLNKVERTLSKVLSINQNNPDKLIPYRVLSHTLNAYKKNGADKNMCESAIEAWSIENYRIAFEQSFNYLSSEFIEARNSNNVLRQQHNLNELKSLFPKDSFTLLASSYMEEKINSESARDLMNQSIKRAQETNQKIEYIENLKSEQLQQNLRIYKNTDGEQRNILGNEIKDNVLSYATTKSGTTSYLNNLLYVYNEIAEVKTDPSFSKALANELSGHITSSPEDYAHRLLYCTLSLQINQLDNTKDHLDYVIGHSTENSELITAHRIYAEYGKKCQNNDITLLHLLAAQSLGDHDQKINKDIAIVYFNQQKYNVSYDIFKSYISANNNDQEATLYCALAAINLDNVSEELQKFAENTFNTIISEANENSLRSQAHVGMTDLMELQAKLNKSNIDLPAEKSHIYSAISLNEENYQAWNKLGKLLLIEKFGQESQKLAREDNKEHAENEKLLEEAKKVYQKLDNHLVDHQDDEGSRLMAIQLKMEFSTENIRKDLDYLNQHAQAKETKIAVHRLEAKLAIDKEDYLGCISHLEAAKMHGDTDSTIDRHLGILYAQQQQFENALTATKNYLSENPNDYQAKVDCGNLYLVIHNQIVLNKKEGSDNYLNVNINNDNYEQLAEKHFSETIAKCEDPKIVSQAYLGKADIHLSNNRTQEAKADAMKATEKDDNNYLAWRKLGHINLSIGNKDKKAIIEAKNNFLKCRTANKIDHENNIDLALTYYMVKDQHNARLLLNEVRDSKEINSKDSIRCLKASTWLNKKSVTNGLFVVFDIVEHYAYKSAHSILTDKNSSFTKKATAATFCVAHVFAKDYIYSRYKQNVIKNLKKEFNDLFGNGEIKNEVIKEQQQFEQSENKNSTKLYNGLRSGFYWGHKFFLAVEILHALEPDDPNLKFLNDNSKYFYLAYDGFNLGDSAYQWWYGNPDDAIKILDTVDVNLLMVAHIGARFINLGLNYILNKLSDKNYIIPESYALYSFQTALDITASSEVGLALGIIISNPEVLTDLYELGAEAVTLFKTSGWLGQIGIGIAVLGTAGCIVYKVKSHMDYKDAATKIRNAVTLFTTGNEKEGLAKLQTVIDWDNAHEDAIRTRDILRSKQELDQKNNKFVIDTLTPHLEKDPDNESMLRLRMFAHAGNKQIDAAESDFDDLYSLSKDRSKLSMEFGISMEQVGEHKLAEKYYKKALAETQNEITELKKKAVTNDNSIKELLATATNKFKTMMEQYTSILRFRMRTLALQVGIPHVLKEYQLLLLEHPNNTLFMSDYIYYQCADHFQNGHTEKVLELTHNLDENIISSELRSTRAQALLKLVSNKDVSLAELNKQSSSNNAEHATNSTKLVEYTKEELRERESRLSEAEQLLETNIRHEIKDQYDFDSRIMLNVTKLMQNKNKQAMESYTNLKNLLEQEIRHVDTDKQADKLKYLLKTKEKVDKQLSNALDEVNKIAEAIKKEISAVYQPLIDLKSDLGVSQDFSNTIGHIQEILTTNLNANKKLLFDHINKHSESVFHHNKPDSKAIISDFLKRMLQVQIEQPSQNTDSVITEGTKEQDKANKSKVEVVYLKDYIVKMKESLVHKQHNLQNIVKDFPKAISDRVRVIEKLLSNVAHLVTNEKMAELTQYSSQVLQEAKGDFSKSVPEIENQYQQKINDITKLEEKFNECEQLLTIELSGVFEKIIKQNISTVWHQHFIECMCAYLSQAMLFLFDFYHQNRIDEFNLKKLPVPNFEQLQDYIYVSPAKYAQTPQTNPNTIRTVQNHFIWKEISHTKSMKEVASKDLLHPVSELDSKTNQKKPTNEYKFILSL